jgi:hypothetical protein
MMTAGNEAGIHGFPPDKICQTSEDKEKGRVISDPAFFIWLPLFSLSIAAIVSTWRRTAF